MLQNPPRMEAMFKVNRPLSLFNYEILTQNIFLYSAEEQERKQHEDVSTYVALNLSMDPLLELPAENEFEYYSGAENPSLLVRGTDWVR